MKKVFLLVVVFSVSFFAKAQWSELGGTNSLGTNQSIGTMCKDAAGNFYVAGSITNTSSSYYIAKYNGSTWAELGGNNSLAANNTIYCICSDATGNVYVVGLFTNANGKYYVAKYNGTNWSELGGANSLGANGFISSVIADAQGNIYATGSFTNASGKYYVAKWDGTSWSELGGVNSLSANGSIVSLYVDATGNIYAGGTFTNGSSITNGKNYVAKFNGTSWSELGGLNALSANGFILKITSDVNNNIYASGQFYDSNSKDYVAKFDGTSWSALGGTSLAAIGAIEGLETDAAGNVYCGGLFYNGSHNYYVAKFDGLNWSELGGNNSLHGNSGISGIIVDANNNIYTAGGFTNNLGSTYVAKYTTSCPAPPHAYFSLSPNSATPHDWIAVNQCTGTAPLSYHWTWGDASAADTSATPTHVYSTAGYYKVCVTASDANGCSSNYCDSSYLSRMNSANAMVTINVVKNTTGINDLSKQYFSLQPNPTATSTTLTFNNELSNATVEVMTITGQTIFKKENQSGKQFSLDLTNQAAGIYFIEVKQTAEVWRGKVVKE